MRHKGKRAWGRRAKGRGKSADVRIGVQANGNAFEAGLGGGIALHDQRIVAGNYVRRGIGQAIEKVEAFEHFRDVVDDGKGAALFEIVVEMRGVGRENDPAAARPDAGALQSGGMTADAVHGEAGRELVIAIVKNSFFFVNVADHLEHVFEIEGRAERAVAHGASGGEGHFAILQMEARGREAVKIAGVVVMEVGDDYVRDAVGIGADEAQRIDWMAQPFATASNGGFIGEAGIEDERGIAAARDPYEIVEIGGELVRIGGDEIFLRMPIAKMAVANGENLEWIDRHARLSAMDLR
jgi:hypothetical protein